MKSYIQPGNVLTLTAPYAVLSGEGALVGSFFGVATGDVANAAEGEFMLVGVHSLKKLSAEAWAVGALIYWDNAAKQCTIVATANTLIGKATVAAANPSATGVVRLNG